MEVWTNQEQAYYLGLPHETGSSLRAGAVSPFTLGVLGIPFPGHISILGPLLLPCYGVRVELGPYGVSGKRGGPCLFGQSEPCSRHRPVLGARGLGSKFHAALTHCAMPSPFTNTESAAWAFDLCKSHRGLC